MAPKSKVVPDDTRSEASSTKDRVANLANGGVNGTKMRRGASNLGVVMQKEPVSAAAQSTQSVAAVAENKDAGQPGIQWLTMDSQTLHSYRHAYRLDVPAAFSDPYHQLILSKPGLAKHSPSMARKRHVRRQSKEQLATSVRKHFNGMGITENDAIVEFLYKVKYQDKAFRLRFTPQRTK